jgi:hypothetical protein
MAIGGVLGDLIGIREVYLAASVVVLVAAGVAWLVFRGAPSARAAAVPVPVEVEAA